MAMQGCSAVLFDLDGTLLNTLVDLADATNRALASLGCPPREVDDYRYLVGDGAEMLVTRALPEDRRDPRTIAKCLEVYWEEYARNMYTKTRPYPGVEEMLGQVAARGLKMAVLSNKPHEFTVQCVERFLGKWKWGIVLGQTEVIARKPSPEGALEVARRLGEPCGRFVYVGDTGTDMLTATAAGMFPVGVLWGFRDRGELEKNGARAVIERPAELIEVIDTGKQA